MRGGEGSGPDQSDRAELGSDEVEAGAGRAWPCAPGGRPARPSTPTGESVRRDEREEGACFHSIHRCLCTLAAATGAGAGSWATERQRERSGSRREPAEIGTRWQAKAGLTGGGRNCILRHPLYAAG